ncbi:hypothetical protein VF724_20640 [Paenibacillaceae bacterium T2]|uniref:Uncharacterized protein n=1 Tax=Ferviditalea candida TaxID=3108399 RepID=A0ABU5ZR51_9BACL|nr:hypothetical protein [Paenibacillaceae bacterium T2]
MQFLDVREPNFLLLDSDDVPVLQLKKNLGDRLSDRARHIGNLLDASASSRSAFLLALPNAPYSPANPEMSLITRARASSVSQILEHFIRLSDARYGDNFEILTIPSLTIKNSSPGSFPKKMVVPFLNVFSENYGEIFLISSGDSC